jgi:NADPH-dependent 2,4-dienoyl-CoA reductase/sulfur reductase-like enzyme
MALLAPQSGLLSPQFRPAVTIKGSLASYEDAFFTLDYEYEASKVKINTPTATTTQKLPMPLPLKKSQKEAGDHDKAIVIIGGGVSGIYAALTLAERGYTNVTILERELRVGGKASSFEHKGQKYPLGAVGTPLALESASFTESQLFEKPGKFVRSLFGRTGRRLQVRKRIERAPVCSLAPV